MEDSIKNNLIAQRERLEELGLLLSSVDVSGKENESELVELKARSEKIKQLLLESGNSVHTTQRYIVNYNGFTEPKKIPLNYEEVTRSNLDYLEIHGLLDKEFDALFTQKELERIERELSSPIQREKWNKWDFVAVLAGSVAGIVADVLTDSTNAKLMEKFGQSQTLHKWASQTKGLSLDYQGPGFGGNLHDGMSSGHDILRPFKAISQIKNGVFVGLKQTPTGFEWIRAVANQYGTPYESYSWLETIILWLKHIGSDAANPTGLPFPGMSFLIGMPDHEVRKFAILLYKNGYTLQYLICQALVPALVECVVRGYILGREYSETGDIKWPSAKKLKTTEMLLASHAIVTAINVGKVAVRCNAEGPIALRKLNVPSIIMTVRYFIPFVVKRMRLNDPVEIIKRNAKEIVEGYDSMILQISDDIKKDDDFRRFLENGDVITV